MDPALERWRPWGRIYLWRYPKSHRASLKGWHFAADAEGCDCLDEALNLLQAARYPGRLKIAVEQRDLPEPFRGNTEPKRPAASLTLSYSRDWPGDTWSIDADEDGHARLSAGDEALEALRAAVSDMRTGEGDYVIWGRDDAALWLWWPPRR
ncbi:MAG: hypothetical protein JSR45_08085 [Proteobacteria bacterium]|nr:hypothetical protein [Pseudomonadota bacterium]